MHPYHVVEKGSSLKEADNALVTIHGRGATALDILSLAGLFTDETFYLAAPQALNNTWYPYSFIAPNRQNEPWLTSAIDLVHTLLQNILKEMTPDKIYIMGFSQGACLATEVAARFADNYGGVIAFTGGLIGETINTENYKGDFKKTKIYLSNGTNDPHVPYSRSVESKMLLEKMGADVTLDIFPDRPHTITEQEIERARKIIFNG